MSSGALLNLLKGIEEVKYLQSAVPQGGVAMHPNVARAMNRSSVVLLTSHLERYLYALNEEAIDEINASSIAPTALPERLRLQHSKPAVDCMTETQWANRLAKLEKFVETDGWLWGDASKGNLEASRLLEWMTTPSSRQIKRLFALWGIADIFDRITRVAHARDRLWTNLDDLVTKRNRIAHGDPTATATVLEITAYLAAVADFCKRADGVMSKAVSKYAGVPRPW